MKKKLRKSLFYQSLCDELLNVLFGLIYYSLHSYVFRSYNVINNITFWEYPVIVMHRFLEKLFFIFYINYKQ